MLSAVTVTKKLLGVVEYYKDLFPSFSANKTIYKTEFISEMQWKENENKMH